MSSRHRLNEFEAGHVSLERTLDTNRISIRADIRPTTHIEGTTNLEFLARTYDRVSP